MLQKVPDRGPRRESMKNRKVAAAALSATLAVGIGIGSIAAPPMAAFAADTSTSTTAAATARTPGQWITDSLKGLVDKGTITQTQSDAIASTLKDAEPKGGRGGHGGHGGFVDAQAAASVLGMTEDELRTAQQTKSLTDIAKDKTVDIQKVIDALVAARNARIDQSVTDGKLTQAQGDEKKANTVDEVTEAVNNVRVPKGDRPERPGEPTQSTASATSAPTA